MLQISSQPRLEVRMENVRVNTKETLVDDFDPLRMRLQEVRESQQFARPRVVDHLRLDLCMSHLYGYGELDWYCITHVLGQIWSRSFLKFGRNGCPGCTGKKVLRIRSGP